MGRDLHRPSYVWGSDGSICLCCTREANSGFNHHTSFASTWTTFKLVSGGIFSNPDGFDLGMGG